MNHEKQAETQNSAVYTILLLLTGGLIGIFISHLIQKMGLIQINYALFFTFLTCIACLFCFSLFHQYQTNKKQTQDNLFELNSFKEFTKQVKKLSGKKIGGCICAMDIKQFNIICERYGTKQSQLILRHTADILRHTLPRNMPVSYLHADTFCFYLDTANPGQIEELLKKLVITLKEETSDSITIHPYFGYHVTKLPVTDVTAFLGYAEIALKNVKYIPGQDILAFKEEMFTKISNEMDLEDDMYIALSDEQFKIYLQPKFSIESLSIVGAEALVRWQHPQKGLIPPNEFIPLFERNGFIKRLDEFMWNKTAEVIAEWMNRGIKPVPVSVNISRVHTLGDALCHKFEEIIARHNISPKYLQLEFTESAFIDNIDELYSTMLHLQQKGFTILMDDFGAGYSSLNMLKDCPADIIKTDKEFLHMEDTQEYRGETVIQHVISMIHDLGLHVVAEGVETENHIRILQECGCEVAQGFFYSPPIPVQEFNKCAFSAKYHTL